ncbi:MAG: SDR family oxidoreductase [Deltaproteobacteria bacterium]|nr:MAG: SDR family oxidoreductase [Deltaproteobacteria bacterium]
MPLDPSSILLTDRVALVTGAAVGIGEAIALTLARFGADLAICDRDQENLAATARAIEGMGRRIVCDVLDVRDADAVQRFLEHVRLEFGRVDVLVNNAGGGFFSAFMDIKPKGEDALVRENFTSVTQLVRGVVPLMPESGGSIINITSIEAHRAGPGYAIYSAMKAGLTNLTQSLALELAGRRIRVNAVAPDAIPTPGIGKPPVRNPLGVSGHVNDVAGAVLFLASDLAGFVTGTTLHVDGGAWAAGGWHRTQDGSFEN